MENTLFSGKHIRAVRISRIRQRISSTKILHPDPEKRISIADMKKHPWWKGATITNVALVTELNRRKNTVDSVKSKEKERKKKEKEKESALESSSLRRALGDSEGSSICDELPVSPPTFAFKQHVYTVAPEPAFTGELSFGEEEETETKEKKPKTLDDTIVRYTRFNSTSSPSKILERVGEVMKSMGIKFSSRDNFKVRAESGPVAFFAQVFADPKIDSQYVVDFRKQKGSGLEFRTIYQDIRLHLADIILQPKKGTETVEST